MSRVSLVSRSMAVVVAALAVIGCGSEVSSSQPLPTPGGYPEIFAAWALNGISVHERTSGEMGCGDPTLTDNALHVVVSMAPDPTPRDVYLFRFRNSVRWADAQPLIDACQATFEAISARAGGPVARVDVSPYRAFGDGWTPELEAALERGLAEIAGDGGIPRGVDANRTPQPSP
ncbi:MAG TPA: hypothetical protein VIF84_05470 [Candidatus Limnocylindrales bacterium]